MNPFAILKPRTLDAACAAVKDGATVKAGGIDILDRMKEGIERPERVLDVRALPELRRIDVVETGDRPALRIGALATLAEVASSPLVTEHAPALAQAAQEAATPQVRNVATVGGNLHQHVRCWYYRSADFEPCHLRGGSECYAKEGRNKVHAIFGTDGPCVAVDPSNLAVPLAALDAELRYRLPAHEGRPVFGGGPVSSVEVQGRTTRDAGSWPRGILAEVIVPITGARSVYLEFGERESFDWALASCAVAGIVRDGKVEDPRVVLGAVARRPHRAEAAEKHLLGKKLTPELAREAAAKALEGARPLAENGFKVAVARALVARALTALGGAK